MTDDRQQTSSYAYAVHVKCPFWKGNTSVAVVCEGLRRGESVRRTCRTAGKMREVMDEICCKSFENCEIYKMLCKKYD